MNKEIDLGKGLTVYPENSKEHILYLKHHSFDIQNYFQNKALPGVSCLSKAIELLQEKVHNNITEIFVKRDFSYIRLEPKIEASHFEFLTILFFLKLEKKKTVTILVPDYSWEENVIGLLDIFNIDIESLEPNFPQL